MIKLKALKPRLYNAMFHTHTVSGIVISFGLFVIFYAGAFSLFRDEIYKWQTPSARFETKKDIDFDATLKFVDEEVESLNLFKNITVRPPSHTNPFLRFTGVYKVKQGKTNSVGYHINPYTKESYKNLYKKTNMANTIYRLHYFRQIPVIGKYLSGFTAFFFLFAIVTGVLIHWKNITNKFYDFRTKGKWKQIWKNTHTVIGAITLPFQFIYAVTGSLLCLSILLLAPSAFLLFEGDTNEIIKLVSPSSVIKYDDNAKDVVNTKTINKLHNEVISKYPSSQIDRVLITNFGKEDGSILFAFNDEKGITADGSLLYRYKNGVLLNEKKPNTGSYTKRTYRILGRLHFGDFGGILVRFIYFVLALLTCYVITSGVMIWKTARETSKYSDKQKRFHHKVTKLYLAFTSGLIPSIALLFIANKILPITMENRVFYETSIFFIGWLLLVIIGLFWNNYRKLNRNYLLIASVLSLLIPVCNGVVTGDWLWKTFSNHQYYVFSVDFSWLLSAIFGLIIVRNINLTSKKSAAIVNE